MKNIGYVLYKKDKETGSLTADWCHSDYGIGTGIATTNGNQGDSFEGIYKIQYFDENGNLQAERELRIEKEDNHYKVSWLNDGVLTAFGIGLKNSEGLSIGYRDVED